AAAILLDDGQPASAVWLLVLDVMADQASKLQAMTAPHLGVVIFPDPEVLVILPRRLMPERRVTLSSPTNSWEARPSSPREDCWKLGRDLFVKALSVGVGGDEDVVARLRKLEFVHRRRRKSG